MGIFARTISGMVITTGARYILYALRSDPNDPDANGGTDYSAHEQWDYPSYINAEFSGEQPWFVASASGRYSMTWKFRTETSSVFQIKITASVNWGEIIYHPGQIHDWWTLDDRGWSNVSRSVTIYA